jgi:hypothetical protein
MAAATTIRTRAGALGSGRRALLARSLRVVLLIAIVASGERRPPRRASHRRTLRCGWRKKSPKLLRGTRCERQLRKGGTGGGNQSSSGSSLPRTILSAKNQTILLRSGTGALRLLLRPGKRWLSKGECVYFSTHSVPRACWIGDAQVQNERSTSPSIANRANPGCVSPSTAAVIAHVPMGKRQLPPVMTGAPAYHSRPPKIARPCAECAHFAPTAGTSRAPVHLFC